MEIKHENYKISLETAVHNAMRKPVWIYGDRFVRKFAEDNRVEMDIKCEAEDWDGTKGFMAECNALEIKTRGWHGNMEGAKRLACWKWMEKLFHKSGADISLYWKCVKKYAKEVLNTEENCAVCGDRVPIEETWQHWEMCVMREKGKWEEETKVECGLCEQQMELREYVSHLINCKEKICDNCGLTIKKMDETNHLKECLVDIIPMTECPFCKINIESKPEKYATHLDNCQEKLRIGREECGLCGGEKEEQHECSKCVICLMPKPVKDWRIFKKCLHYVCNNCEQGLLRVSEGRWIVCPTCRERSTIPLKRLFM